MPTVSVVKTKLFKALALPDTYTDKEFDHLCFEFGIELDEITSEREIAAKGIKDKSSVDLSTISDEVVYKIDCPANRYDILCQEGLARSLRVFLDKEAVPVFNVVTPPADKIVKITVSKATKSIRPFVVGAVLRNVTFDADR
jgi:phenylalanyl-tRNA synthetase beta chain